MLSIIVGIGVIKEGVTDYSRHQSDKKMNATPVKKIGSLEKGPNDTVNIELKDVRVGDIVVLGNKDQIPADCVVL